MQRWTNESGVHSKILALNSYFELRAINPWSALTDPVAFHAAGVAYRYPSSTMQKSSTLTRALPAISAVLGAMIGAGATISAQKIQLGGGVANECRTLVGKREEQLRQKAESFLVALNGVLTAYRPNFSIDEMREMHGRLQGAALALSAYSSDKLAAHSLAIASAAKATLNSSSRSEWEAAIGRSNEINQQWHGAFRAELGALEKQRVSCREGT